MMAPFHCRILTSSIIVGKLTVSIKGFGALVFALLILHVVSGSIALLSGLVAMASRKTGQSSHQRAGNAFYAAMSVMAGTAAALTLWEPDRLSLGAAVWTFYLVHTARHAARSRSAGLDSMGRWLALAGLLSTAIFLDGGAAAYAARDGEFQGMSFVAFFLFGMLAAVALLFDLSLIWRPRLSTRQRIARHLWRMVAAYFLAVTSLFLGQQDDVFPFMAGSPILMLPSLLTLAFLFFWIFRVRFARNWAGTRPTSRSTLHN